jgi:YidC/Oxa1 family membrane protein insertase
LLNPLYIAVSWVLLRWHQLFTSIGLSPGGGMSWALSIVMLVVTIRILLFRFFIKQVHSQRKMQQMQPKIQALREKYKSDRQTLSQEMMKLQREEGFNPLGGCLPVLLQAPIFLSLFHVLRIVGTPKAGALSTEYHWKASEAVSAGSAKLFGAPIASAFRTPVDQLAGLHGDPTATKIVTFVLIILMCAATFITQRQIMRTSGQVLEGQQAMIQKLLLYGMPISLFFSGFFFPLGVLLYWFTNNVWTMGQQFYILHRHPHPNAVKKDGAKPAVDPKALAPKPGQKPVKPRARRPATPPASRPPGSATPDQPEAGKPAEPAESADGNAPSPPPSANPPAGPANTPRPARRPPGQRSSTTTRPKKKRR